MASPGTCPCLPGVSPAVGAVPALFRAQVQAEDRSGAPPRRSAPVQSTFARYFPGRMGALTWKDDIAMPYVDTDLCTGCGDCEDACHVPGAIVLEGDYASVDQTLCDGCGECVEVCPTGAMQAGPEPGRKTPRQTPTREEAAPHVELSNPVETDREREVPQAAQSASVAKTTDPRLQKEDGGRRGRQRAGRREGGRLRKRRRQRRGGCGRDSSDS